MAHVKLLYTDEKKSILLFAAPFSLLVRCDEAHEFSLSASGLYFANCHFLDPIHEAVLFDNLYHVRCVCLEKPSSLAGVAFSEVT